MKFHIYPSINVFFCFFFTCKMNRTTLCQMEKKMSRTAYWKWCTLTVILLDTTDALPIIALDNLMVARFLSTFYVSVLFFLIEKNVWFEKKISLEIRLNVKKRSTVFHANIKLYESFGDIPFKLFTHKKNIEYNLIEIFQFLPEIEKNNEVFSYTNCPLWI